jgi:hypothetical protein
MTTGVVAQGCPVHEGFDPLSPQYLDDPFAVMAALPLEELTARFPRLRLVEGQQLTFHLNISLRGPQTLMVRRG